jgi:anti-sigma factor RsiW
MNCPLERQEGTEVLLDFCSGALPMEATPRVERHLEACAACRHFVREQRAVLKALDSWAPTPVSSDFDRKLYHRIEQQSTWRGSVMRWFRPLGAYHGVPAALAACLLITAGVLIQRPGSAPAKPAVAILDVQPEQVEAALDAMDTLSEFSRKVRSEGADPKL